MSLILASGSATRRRMLEAAGIAFDVMLPDYDEEAGKAAAPGLDSPGLAALLAAGKALAIDAPASLVLGADQILEAPDGRTFGKPADLDQARRQLSDLRGRTHRLHSAAALARDGAIVWAGIEAVTLHVRPFSDAFLDSYLAAEGEAILSSAGAYRIEGLGAQLFDAVEGSHFAVLGLPLFNLLAALRRFGDLTS